MKIQEMRSGSLHLNKKLEVARSEKLYLVPPAAAPQETPFPTAENKCELDDALWAVVSFEQLEAGGLTYDQADAVMSELESLGVPGLCIITRRAAAGITVEPV